MQQALLLPALRVGRAHELAQKQLKEFAGLSLQSLYYIQIPLRSPHAPHLQKSSPLPPPKKKNQLLHQKPYL